MNLPPDNNEKYKEVVKLLEEECDKDPKEDPHRSRYKAKSILESIEADLTEKLNSVGSDHPHFPFYSAMLVAILYQIGVISIDSEEPSAGEEYLMRAFQMIGDHADSLFVITSLNIRNQLGIIWSQRFEFQRAQSWLEDAEKLYVEFVDKHPGEIALTAKDLFQVKNSGADLKSTKELEKVHTLTKFYLAQVYGSTKALLKSAIYCHETLRRQLLFDEYDPIDWALNSATLSQFFMERILFTQARHHLAAATHVLNEYEISTQKSESTELEGRSEEIRHRTADVSRCWAKYGIFLLEYSKNILANSNPDKEPESENDALKNLWFSMLDLSLYENEIADVAAATFEEAREIFLVTQKHINQAKTYYSLECHASDHVQVVQDHSQLFRHLMAFENNADTQCKMIKKRIFMLEEVLKELNPQYYLHACRQLWFELGETYHDLMHIKFKKIKESKATPMPQALKKINFLIEKSIENFSHFVDTIREKTIKSLPELLDEDLIRPTLIAHFYLGRLHYKIVTADKIKQIENTNKSYACFKYFVDYCEKNESAKKTLTEELNVSKEMMVLLQMKIQQI